jgi:hypothetical protein
MLHDEGCIGQCRPVTDEMIDQMNRDLADAQRCEAAITDEELEAMERIERDRLAREEWSKRWAAMCERHEKRRKARERYQAKKAGKAVAL